MSSSTVYAKYPKGRMWDELGFIFEDFGFEAYEKMEMKTYLEHDIHQEAGAPAKRRLEELCEARMSSKQIADWEASRRTIAAVDVDCSTPTTRSPWKS